MRSVRVLFVNVSPRLVAEAREIVAKLGQEKPVG